MRISAISFFAVVFLVAALVVRTLWNVLAKDFPRLPRLSYKKALAATFLLGLCLVAVLVMIAGARELLTPGAWQRRGPLYAVADPQSPGVNPPPQADAPQTADRKEHLERLRDALWQFAAKHGGQFPAADDKEISAEAWEVPGGVGTRYLYVPGLAIDKPPLLLVYEPALNGDERYVLSTGGQVELDLLGRTPPPPGRGEEAVKTLIKWTVGLVVAFIIIILASALFADPSVPLVFVFGWIMYPKRVLAEMSVEPVALVVAGVALVLLVALVHVSASRFRRAVAGVAGLRPRWRLRWTLLGVFLVLTLFAAAIALAAEVDEVAWLLRADQPLIVNGDEVKGNRIMSQEILKVHGVAAKSYEEREHAFPPGGTFNQYGEPQHSWETLLLPYTEEWLKPNLASLGTIRRTPDTSAPASRSSSTPTSAARASMRGATP